MNLDIRLPIGLLFVLMGALLIAYGLFTHLSQPSLYDRSLGININLWWGLAMLLFGALMGWLGLKGAGEGSSPTH